MKIFKAAIIFAILAGATAFSQTEIFFDNFESYEANQKLAEQDQGGFWTTWDETKGGPTDPSVSDFIAYSGSKSVNVITNNDLVLKLNNLNSNRYRVEFYMYVSTSNCAYFNALQKFAGKNSDWGIQVFFQENDSGYVDAGGEKTGLFVFPHDEWFKVDLIVDLDDDFATLLISGQEIVSWKWSSGSFGADSTKALDAVNFYGWTNEATRIGSNYYVDDVRVLEIEAPQASLNLDYSLDENNLSLFWSAPENPPISYAVEKNGAIIVKNVADTSYQDLNLYPGHYEYSVRAFYGEDGYSLSSNKIDFTIEGGSNRNLVLFEIHTGTWCGYCPGAAMGADDLEKNGQAVAIIEWHNGDPYANADCQYRERYYGVRSFPTALADGILKHIGGNPSNSVYDAYLNLYEQRKDVPALYDLNLSVKSIGNDTYKAFVKASELYKYYSGKFNLRLVLTESRIPQVWGSGGIMKEVNFVARKIIPDSAGFVLDFSNASEFSDSVEFNIFGYEKDNCELVAFIQNDSTKEVYQTAKVELSSVTSVENSGAGDEISLYPNPASDFVYLRVPSGRGYAAIYDATGRKVISKAIFSRTTRIDASDLPPGLYIAKIRTDKEIVAKKLIIK